MSDEKTEGAKPAREMRDPATSDQPVLDILIDMGRHQTKGQKLMVKAVFYLIMAAAAAVVLAAIASKF